MIKLRIDSYYQNSLEFKSNSKLRSIFEFLFKIYCELVQVINIKVAPNVLIYLLVKFQIFRGFSLFIFLFCAIGKRLKQNLKSYFYFLSGSTRQSKSVCLLLLTRTP
jgi:hypothetical protein